MWEKKTETGRFSVRSQLLGARNTFEQNKAELYQFALSVRFRDGRISLISSSISIWISPVLNYAPYLLEISRYIINCNWRHKVRFPQFNQTIESRRAAPFINSNKLQSKLDACVRA